MSAGSVPDRAPQTARGAFLRAVDALSGFCGLLAALMIVASVLITCQMIVVRFVLNQSTVWQTEMVIYLMIGATLIGLPYVQKLRGHVNVDLLPIWLGNRARRLLAVYEQAGPMIQIGIYRPGADPEIDEAVRVWPALDAFFASRAENPEAAFMELAAILAPPEPEEEVTPPAANP